MKIIGCLLDYNYMKKSPLINSNWFEQRRRIRCWSKSHSTNKVCWPIKNIDGINADKAEAMFILII